MRIWAATKSSTGQFAHCRYFRRSPLILKELMNLEKLAIPPPWAQGVGRSNRPAPTNRISSLRPFRTSVKTAVDEFVAVVSLKIHLPNTLGSAPVIPPQWRNDRGPSLKFNRESDPLCPRRRCGHFIPLHKTLRISGLRRQHLQCANWPVDDFVAADFLKIQQPGTAVAR